MFVVRLLGNAAEVPLELNSAASATWVGVHHSGGVGSCYSLHAAMEIMADCIDAVRLAHAKLRLQR